jgi:hypothetical protein
VKPATIQGRVFALLRGAQYPMTTEHIGQALDLPYESAREAVRALHARDLIVPMLNRRRGQVWAAGKDVPVPVDGRGKSAGSRAALGLLPDAMCERVAA